MDSTRLIWHIKNSDLYSKPFGVGRDANGGGVLAVGARQHNLAFDERAPVIYERGKHLMPFLFRLSVHNVYYFSLATCGTHPTPIFVLLLSAVWLRSFSATFCSSDI